MKYLKLFENFQSEDEVMKICKQYDLPGCKFNQETGLVDSRFAVNLEDKGLDKLPLNFGNVAGFFDCGRNNLTSLEGSPKFVGGYFDCSYSEKLTSLEGAPKTVENFFCYSCVLTSLEGISKEIKGGKISVFGNPNIYSLKGLEGVKFNELYIHGTAFFEISKFVKQWDSVAMYEYFHFDFLYQENGEWFCELEKLNWFLEIMSDHNGNPFEEVTELKNYKCV